MSYILEALKKSDQQRQQEQVPNLNTVHIEPPPSEMKKSSWPYLLAGIFLLNVIFILFFIMRPNQPTTEPQAAMPNSDHHQSATVQEKQVGVEPQLTQVLSPVTQQPPPEDLVATVDKNIVVNVEESDKSPSEESSSATLVVYESDTVKAEKKITSEKNIAGDQEEAHIEPVEELAAKATHKEAAKEIVSEPANNIVPQEDVVIALEPESTEIANFPEEQSEKPAINQSQQALLTSPAVSLPTATKNKSPKKPIFVHQLPSSIRQKIPEIHISAHVYYKNKPSSRLASINGRLMREGQTLASDLKVAEISSDGVIFSYQKNLFYVPVF